MYKVGHKMYKISLLHYFNIQSNKYDYWYEY